MRSTTDAFVCSENSAMLECIRMRRESRLSNMRERSYHTNPIEHLHAGHEFVDRERAQVRTQTGRASAENSCQSWQECCPSLVIFRNVVRIVSVKYTRV